MTFPEVLYRSESWTTKKAEFGKIDAFELQCWRRLLKVPWTARRSNQSILKEINPAYSLEGLMLKLKLQYIGHLMWRADSLKKNPNAGKDWRQEKKGTTEDEIVGWYWANSRRLWRTRKPGVLQSMSHKEFHRTVQLNNNKQVYSSILCAPNFHFPDD